MLKPKPWRIPMVTRHHSEPHRQASWLELLFDLSFVVAVAQAARQLEHAFVEGHVAEGLLGFSIVFAAIWWAWMAFSWFANVFDTDDVPYRLLMFVMIGGSLGLAAGVPDLFAFDFRIGVISYVVMRLAYVAQWARVYRTGDAVWRPIALKMMTLTTLIQAGWVLFLWVPNAYQMPVLIALFAVEFAIPYFAGWDARMGGHRHHIVERYGLFTIIVLGESIASATVAISGAIGADVNMSPLLLLSLGGIVTAFAIWWTYFDFSSGRAPERDRGAQYFWGYAHFFVFASLAALGAGIALAVTFIADAEHVAVDVRTVAMLIGGPVALFLLTIGLIEGIAEEAFGLGDVVKKLIAAAVIVGCAIAAPSLTLSGAVLAISLVLTLLVLHGVRLQHQGHLAAGHPET